MASTSYSATPTEEFSVIQIPERRATDPAFYWKVSTALLGVVAVAFIVATVAVSGQSTETIVYVTPDATGTELAATTELAGTKCWSVDKYKRSTDAWCMNNCLHAGAKYCPPSFCKCGPIPAAAPPPAPPPPADDNKDNAMCVNTGLHKRTSSMTVTCCASSCGTCGGHGCAKRNGGNKNCCVTTIKEGGRICTDGKLPPCQYEKKLTAPELAAATELATPAELAAPTELAGTKCWSVDKYKRSTDAWCMNNCLHAGAKYCPPSFCKCGPIPAAAPPPAPPPPADDNKDNAMCVNTGLHKWTSSMTVTCCASSCGTCGGHGCAKRNGGNKNCCVTTIKEGGRICTDGKLPPCQYEKTLTAPELAAATELAVHVAPPTELGARFTCIDRWRRCTDAWCTVNCNHNPSYCPRSFCRAAAVAPPVPPPPPPLPKPKTEDPKCLSGIMGVYYASSTKRGDGESIKGSAICCPASCGKCGGAKCGDRPGGSAACCSDKVFALGSKCSSNMAPCVGVEF